MLPVADGSDMCGSLRNPAGWNNVFGFRTSPGRVAVGPSNELFLSQMGVKGPMARNVADLALLLGVQAGYDPRAPLSLDDGFAWPARDRRRDRDLARRLARRSRRPSAGRAGRPRSVRGRARTRAKPATSASSRSFRISTSRRCGRPSSRCATRPAGRRSKSTTTIPRQRDPAETRSGVGDRGRARPDGARDP